MATRARPPLLSNDSNGLATFYNAMLAPQQIVLPPHLFDPCRALMDDRIAKLMVIIGPGSGKSLLLSVVYPAFCIGQDPGSTFLGISAGENLIQGFQKTVMDWVEFSPTYHRIFPDVAPDKAAGWSTERGMFVTGHEAGNPDSNYFASGLTSSALTGKHARKVNCDDIHNKENSASGEACLKVQGDYYKNIIGRADPRGCKFTLAGRRWHTADIYEHLKQGGDWVVMELPAERTAETNELYWDITIPDGLICCFNDGSHPLDMEINKGNRSPRQ